MWRVDLVIGDWGVDFGLLCDLGLIIIQSSSNQSTPNYNIQAFLLV